MNVVVFWIKLQIRTEFKFHSMNLYPDQQTNDIEQFFFTKEQQVYYDSHALNQITILKIN